MALDSLIKPQKGYRLFKSKFRLFRNTHQHIVLAIIHIRNSLLSDRHLLVITLSFTRTKLTWITRGDCLTLALQHLLCQCPEHFILSLYKKHFNDRYISRGYEASVFSCVISYVSIEFTQFQLFKQTKAKARQHLKLQSYLNVLICRHSKLKGLSKIHNAVSSFSPDLFYFKCMNSK